MRIRSRFLTQFVGWFAALVFRTLSRTLRFRRLAEAPGTDCSFPTARTYAYALWHDEILIPLALKALVSRNVAALVSRHQDGAYLAEFMHHLGIRSIRGSTSRGGDQALRELLQQDDSSHIFITPDGPRGPQHEVKDGIIYLASRSGRPIVPVATYFEDAWHVPGSWTGLWVPKPFGRCWYFLGTPIEVPEDLDREQIAWHRYHLQAEMERVQQKLAQIVRGIEPATTYRRAA